MKPSTFLSILTFCTLVASFGIMIIGAWLEKGQLWVNLFALFFVIGAVAFLGYLKAINREEKLK